MTQIPISTDTGRTDRATELSIRQQNINKSLTAQNNFLHQLNPDVYDLGAIQEPYLDHCHNSHASHHWYTIYHKEHYVTPTKTRLLMLVNKHLATDTWSQVGCGLSDITAVQLQMERGRVLIINTYNEGGQQQGLTGATQTMKARSRDTNVATHAQHMIWLGDFNLHHPMWDKARNAHLFTRENLEKSQSLIDAVTELDLQMVLPKDTPMLRALSSGNYTRPDNVFISSLLTNC